MPLQFGAVWRQTSKGRTWQGVQESKLQALRQTSGEALHIQLRRVPALWLQEHLWCNITSFSRSLTDRLVGCLKQRSLPDKGQSAGYAARFLGSAISAARGWTKLDGWQCHSRSCALTWWLSLSLKRTILSSIEGQYRGPFESTQPPYTGVSARFSSMRRCVSGVVRVRWQSICGRSICTCAQTHHCQQKNVARLDCSTGTPLTGLMQPEQASSSPVMVAQTNET